MRNVETLEWESVCPVYDSGRSMCTDYTELYWIFENNEVKCFTNNCIDSEKLVSYFDTPIKESQIASLRKVVPEYIEILKENQSYIKLFDNQIDMLKDGLNLRIDKFESIMHQRSFDIVRKRNRRHDRKSESKRRNNVHISMKKKRRNGKNTLSKGRIKAFFLFFVAILPHFLGGKNMSWIHDEDVRHYLKIIGAVVFSVSWFFACCCSFSNRKGK